MTRAHRQRHRRFMIVLFVMLPLLFVAALAARRKVPAIPDFNFGIAR